MKIMDYIKLSSDEIADEIDAIVNGAKNAPSSIEERKIWLIALP